MENFTANITQQSGSDYYFESWSAGALLTPDYTYATWVDNDVDHPGAITFRPDGEAGILKKNGDLITGLVIPNTMEGVYATYMLNGTEEKAHKNPDNTGFNFTTSYMDGVIAEPVIMHLYDSATGTLCDTKTFRFINEVNE